MNQTRILGIVLLVAGLIGLAFAYQGSQSILDQTKNVFTGEYRDRTTWFLIGGTLAAVAGVILLVVPTNRRLGYGGGYAAP